MADRVNTNVRLPAELHARLQQEAEQRGLSLNYLVTRLLYESLPRLIPANELRLTNARNSEGPEPQSAISERGVT